MTIESGEITGVEPLLLENPISMNGEFEDHDELILEDERPDTNVIKIAMKRTNYRKLNFSETTVLSENEIDRLFEEVSAHLTAESSGQNIRKVSKLSL